MEDLKIVKGNISIALFMSEEPDVLKWDLKRGCVRPDSFHYHKEWEWLFPAIVKIADMHESGFQYHHLNGHNFELLPGSKLYTHGHGNSMIEAAWDAVVEFIPKYNRMMAGAKLERIKYNGNRYH